MARDTQYTLYKTARTDPTFKNIWAFESEEQRDVWLNTCSPQPFLNNKYWRVGNAIKCPIRYEESFNYDYVRIVNRNMDANQRKTWFCFITGRTYISNNCTMFTLAVDYVQTFYFSKAIDGGTQPFWQVDGFISTATNSTLPPRGTPSEYPVPEVSCYNLYYNATGYSVVIYSSVDIRDLSSLKYVSAVIDGQYTASPPFIMAANVDAISTLINDVNTAGYTDAISGIYLVPNDYLNLTEVSTTPTLATSSSLYKTVNRTVSKPTSCDGYTPVNKQLLGYDYSYFTINNGQGEVSTWHFEDFDGDPVFASRLSLASGSPVIIIYPTNYINSDQNDYRQLAVKITQAPACSFLNDSYKIWLAQTQNSRAAAVNGAQLAIAQAEEARRNSFSAQINKGASIVSQWYNSKFSTQEVQEEYSDESWNKRLQSSLNEIGSLQSKIMSLPIFGSWGKEAAAYNNQQIAQTVNSIANVPQKQLPDMTWAKDLGLAYVRKQLGIEHAYVYDQNVATAQQNLKELLAGYKDKARVPATAVGSNAYGDVCVLKQYGFMIATYTPTAFYAEWIDKQLTAGGHTVNQYGIVNKNHAIFDYFEVLSPYIAAERDGRPQYARNMLVSLLSQGVYLWYVYQGDISDKIGVPYGIDNPKIT